MVRDEMIVVEGLRDLSKKAKEMGDPKIIGEAHKQIGAWVNERATDRADDLSREYPSYRKMKMRTSAAKNAVAVFARKPLGHAAEFGMKRHVVFGRSISADKMKRRVWPEHSNDGYLFHPVLRDNKDEIIELYQQAIEDAADRIWNTD